jgi:hypothetical protein
MLLYCIIQIQWGSTNTESIHRTNSHDKIFRKKNSKETPQFYLFTPHATSREVAGSIPDDVIDFSFQFT